VLGFIDASECVPTYGASFDDVRGFVVGGWKNITEVDLSTMPKLQGNDTVVLLCKTAQFVRTVEDTVPAVAGHAKRFVVRVGDACNENSSSASVCITDVSDQGAREFSIKLILNAISTGAHVLRGMTFGNRMINVRVSNSKLYYRAIRIISALGKVEEPKAEVMLQRSLYMVDQVTDEITKMPVSDHVVQACKREKVVPIALLLCTEKFTFAEAQTILNEDPIVRRVVRKYVS
jgi:N-acetylmuramic acid 6-phosphate (MurNAc-6-P) etherase